MRFTLEQGSFIFERSLWIDDYVNATFFSVWFTFVESFNVVLVKFPDCWVDENRVATRLPNSLANVRTYIRTCVGAGTLSECKSVDESDTRDKNCLELCD